MSKHSRMKRELKKLRKAQGGGGWQQLEQVFTNVAKEGVPALLEQIIKSGDFDGFLRAVRDSREGTTLEVSPEDQRELYQRKFLLCTERRAEIVERIAKLEAKAETHEHKEATLDDLTPENHVKLLNYLHAVKGAVAAYNREPTPVLVGPPIVSLKGQAINVAAIHGAVADRLVAGLTLEAEHVAVLLADVQAHGLKELAPCCDDCAEGKGGCGSSLSKARGQLENVDRELAFWDFASEHVAEDRNAHLSLAQVAKLHGLPGAWFEGL